MDDVTLTRFRYCFQRVLVPCVVTIGVLGNFVTVLVLTRRRMRCSTNVYLTALAVVDIIFLLFVFVLSLNHYPNIHHARHELYWRTFGISHWFCDAASYTSIYLTVSFTIERYIAVCHPIRGQVLCTEARAKKVISGVVILCFLLTCSTAFEYQLTTTNETIDGRTGKLCQNVSTLHLNDSATFFAAPSTTPGYAVNAINDKANQMHNVENMKNVRDEEIQEHFFDTIQELVENSTNVPDELNGPEEPCYVQYYIYPQQSSLGLNVTYKTIFYYFTVVVFMFLPLMMLATFNCFLIAAVHRSHRMRNAMTNRPVDATISAQSMAQENKITITLIAVVLLFLVCQTPSAILLIYSLFTPDNLTREEENLQKALGNLMNFLVTLNAACNFLLYCALSDKYRQTVKQLLMGKRARRNNTITSRLSQYASGGDRPSSMYNKQLNPQRNGSNRQRQRAPSIAFDEFPLQKKNLPPAAGMMNPVRKTSDGSPYRCDAHSVNQSMSPRTVSNECQSNQDNHCAKLLNPSPSQTSLTRSRSLIMPHKTRHSPDCRDNPDKL